MIHAVYARTRSLNAAVTIRVRFRPITGILLSYNASSSLNR